MHVFNVFDMNFYRAGDPLPGASGVGASMWGRLGDRLIEGGVYKSVLLVPIAFSASSAKDWAPGGHCYRRLQFALRRLKRAGRVATLRSCVITSGRRWEQHGVARTILLMWWLRLLFFLGASPDRLKRLYRDAR